MKKYLIGISLVLIVAGVVWVAMAPSVVRAQIYADGGVSNYAGGGWVFGQSIVPYTNSAGTSVWLTAKAVPLGFFGAHSTNQQTVANLPVTLTCTNLDVTLQAAVTNIATVVSNLVNALKAYGLIK